MSAIYLTTYAKAWSDYGVEHVHVRVDGDEVRVFDDVAGYYTLRHSLSDSALRRIRKLARLKRESI